MRGGSGAQDDGGGYDKVSQSSSKNRQHRRQAKRPQLPLDWCEEDIIPVYMALRIICDTLGEPTLIDKIMAPHSSTGIGPMDLMMMCCIKKNPALWKKAVAEGSKPPKPVPQNRMSQARR